MKQITEEKFRAIQVLAEDFSATSSGLRFDDEHIDLTINRSGKDSAVKLRMLGTGTIPIKRIEITYDIDAFKNLGYDDMIRILEDMERGVVT